MKVQKGQEAKHRINVQYGLVCLIVPNSAIFAIEYEMS